MEQQNEKVDNDILRALGLIDAILVGLKDRYGPTSPEEAERALQIFTDTMTAQEANRPAWHQRTMQYAALVAQRIVIDQNAHIMGFLAKLGETLQAGFTASDQAHREAMVLFADTIASALGLEEQPSPAPPKLSVVPKPAQPAQPAPTRGGRKKAEDEGARDKKAEDQGSEPTGGANA